MSTHRALDIIRDEHAALAAMLRSLMAMVERGPLDAQSTFFDVVRAMLFYIDEFPERLHHPKESNHLFPRVARLSPQLMGTVGRLEQEHMEGEARVRHLQHLLLAWELLGATRRAEFDSALRQYVDFYLEHMRLEESEILPEAERVLSAQDWAELDVAFSAHPDPLADPAMRDPVYDRLFTRIVTRAPAPVGLGA
jgi:hemerythrin-like domain-containing protein